MLGLILVIAALGLLWVLFIVPQRRRKHVQDSMLAELAVGDEVLTVGGMYGEVLDMDEDQVLIEVAPGTSIRFARRAIAAIVEPDQDEPELESEPDPAEPLENFESDPQEPR